MKNKNRPRREKQRKRPGTKRVMPFNPWIAKYFDLSGTGIEEAVENYNSKKARNTIEMQNMRQKNEAQSRKPSGDKKA